MTSLIKGNSLSSTSFSLKLKRLRIREKLPACCVSITNVSTVGSLIWIRHRIGDKRSDRNLLVLNSSPLTIKEKSLSYI